MRTVKFAAMVLIVAGALGLLYGTFSRTTDTVQARSGAFELELRDQHTVNVPLWVGAFVLLAGGLLRVLPRYPRADHLFWREPT